MLFTLGQRTQSGDVVDLLLACHHRIREHIALARRIANAPATTAPDSVRAAAQRVRTYFAMAFPLHRKDEEDDIFPLLIGRSDVLDAAIGELMRDHDEHEQQVAAVVEICATLENDPSQQHVLAAKLGAAVRALEDEVAEHIGLEERTVFPAIAMMSTPERESIVERMQARREQIP